MVRLWEDKLKKFRSNADIKALREIPSGVINSWSLNVLRDGIDNGVQKGLDRKGDGGRKAVRKVGSQGEMLMFVLQRLTTFLWLWCFFLWVCNDGTRSELGFAGVGDGKDEGDSPRIRRLQRGFLGGVFAIIECTWGKLHGMVMNYPPLEYRHYYYRQDRAHCSYCDKREGEFCN